VEFVSYVQSEIAVVDKSVNYSAPIFYKRVAGFLINNSLISEIAGALSVGV